MFDLRYCDIFFVKIPKEERLIILLERVLISCKLLIVTKKAYIIELRHEIYFFLDF